MAITFSISNYSYTLSGNSAKIGSFKLTLNDITRDVEGNINITKNKAIMTDDTGTYGTDYFDVDIKYSFDNTGSVSEWSSLDVFYVDAPSGYRILAHDLYYHPEGERYNSRWAGGDISDWSWHPDSNDPYGGRWWIDEITWKSTDTPSGGHFNNISITQSNRQAGTIYLAMAYRGHINSCDFDSWHYTGVQTISYPKVPYPSATTTQVTTSNNIIYASNQTINKEFYGLWDRVNTICSYHGISGLGNFTTPTQYTTEITLTNYGNVLNKIKELLNNTDFTIPNSATEAYAAANRINNISYSANSSTIPQLSDYCTVVNYWTSNDI